MSNFELLYTELEGIRYRIQSSGENLADCAARLRRQYSNLGNQRGFGIESIRANINGLAANTSTHSGNAYKIAAFLSDLEKIVAESENQAFSVLQEAAPVEVKLTDAMVTWNPSTVAPATPVWTIAYSQLSSITQMLVSVLNPKSDWNIWSWLADDHSASLVWKSVGAEWSSGDVYAGVNAEIGKIETKYESGFTLFSTKSEDEYNKSTGEWKNKSEYTFVDAVLSVGITGTALSGDAKAGAGNDMLGAEISAEGAIGKGELGAEGRVNIGENGVNAYVKGEAKITAAEGELKGTLNILGLEIVGKVEGYAGSLGVEVEAGIKDNKFVLEGGVAAILGFGVGIEIGLNDTGWKTVTENMEESFNDIVKLIGNIFV